MGELSNELDCLLCIKARLNLATSLTGASVLTDPIRFTLGEQQVTSATSSYSSAVGTISGIVASILAILLAAAAIVFYRRHRSHHGKAGGNGNVAFENPTYTRGLEQVQVCTLSINYCYNPVISQQQRL